MTKGKKRRKQLDNTTLMQKTNTTKLTNINIHKYRKILTKNSTNTLTQAQTPKHKRKLKHKHLTIYQIFSKKIKWPDTQKQ